MNFHFCSGIIIPVSRDQATSPNFSVPQIDLGLDRAPQILNGWAIDLADQGSDRCPYRVHNLEYGYRLAPPFSENEAIRAIGILGHAATQPNGVDANNLVESAWAAITSGGAI